jgi:hypothetical protein
MADNSITVATGDYKVNGNLTNFVAAAGDLLVANGVTAIIEGALSTSQLQLRFPWPGPPLTDYTNWDILPTGPYWSSAVTTNRKVTELIQRLEGGLPLKPDRAGPISERSQYNSQSEGFLFLQTDIYPFLLYVKTGPGPEDWSAGQRLQADVGAETADAIASAQAAHASEVASAASAVEAQTAELGAKGSEDRARQSEINSAQSATDSATSAGASAASASQSLASQQAAATSEGNAAASATASESSRLASEQARDLSRQHRDTAQGYMNESFGARDTTQGYMNEAYGARDTAEIWKNETFGARQDTFAARDTSIAARDTTLDARDTALGARDTAVQAAADADADRIAAQAAAVATADDRQVVSDLHDGVVADRTAVATMRDEVEDDRAEVAANTAATAASEANAAASAEGAETARTGAETAMAGSEAARDESVAARDTARLWATGAEDTPVSGSEYSAYHWAKKAQAFSTGASSNISVIPVGSLASTDVQSALEELDTEKVPITRTVNGKPLSADVALTKTDVGLSAVDNTSDASKPVSTAQQTALNGKVDKTTTVAGKALSGNITLAKADVGLGNVDNTSDLNKPISTATQTALSGKLGNTGNQSISGTLSATHVYSTSGSFRSQGWGGNAKAGVLYLGEGNTYLYYDGGAFNLVGGTLNMSGAINLGAYQLQFARGGKIFDNGSDRMVIQTPTGGIIGFINAAGSAWNYELSDNAATFNRFAYFNGMAETQGAENGWWMHYPGVRRARWKAGGDGRIYLQDQGGGVLLSILGDGDTYKGNGHRFITTDNFMSYFATRSAGHTTHTLSDSVTMVEDGGLTLYCFRNASGDVVVVWSKVQQYHWNGTWYNFG